MLFKICLFKCYNIKNSYHVFCIAETTRGYSVSDYVVNIPAIVFFDKIVTHMGVVSYFILGKTSRLKSFVPQKLSSLINHLNLNTYFVLFGKVIPPPILIAAVYRPPDVNIRSDDKL